MLEYVVPVSRLDTHSHFVRLGYAGYGENKV
jgi:hypothetical protein